MMAPFDILTLAKLDCFIPLKRQSKEPIEASWPSSGRPLESINSKSNNVGILLGEPSGVLDIDLDCLEAKELAPIILPKPSACFSWGSPSSGHYFYKANDFGPRTSFSSDETGTLLELRGDGSQTMCPPSVHPSGNMLEFTTLNSEAESVCYQDLKRCASLLAASAEVSQRWIEGIRHDLALAFAGLCLKEGVDPNLIVHIIQGICKITGDAEALDRINAAKNTCAKPPSLVRGYEGLVELFGLKTARRLADNVKAYCGHETTQSVSVYTPSNVLPLSVGSFADRSNLTEARIGQAFNCWLADKAIHIQNTKRWMVWNGIHYELDERNAILNLAHQFISEIKTRLFREGKHSDAESVKAFESLRKLENITKLASIDRSVSQEYLDQEQYLVAAENTWINLKTGEAVDPSPETLITKRLEAPYHKGAKCPQFLHFLDQIFEGNQELIRFVQRAIGYSLTGSIEEQCFFIMIGDGANGKSTFINIIKRLMRDYGNSAAAQTLIANGKGSDINEDVVDLIGARLITVSETEDGQSLAEAKIKQMTGGDTIKGRPIYGQYVQFIVTGKLWLATNSLPHIRNTDHGIWRRIMAIPFQKTFTAEEQDKALGSKLQKELPGILSWAVEGAIAWQNEGLSPPPIVEAQVAEYKTSMDSIAQWIQDECEVAADKSFPAAKLYGEYNHWCTVYGHKPQSNVAFKRALEKLDGVHQVRVAGGNKWIGIAPSATSSLM